MEPSFPTHTSHGKMKENEIVRYICSPPFFSPNMIQFNMEFFMIMMPFSSFPLFYFILLPSFVVDVSPPFFSFRHPPQIASLNLTETPTKATAALDQEQDAQYGDRQFMVIASEKQCRIIALPSQNCVYRLQITDTDFVVRAEVISLKGQCCKYYL
jgi:hypothetical protein